MTTIILHLSHYLKNNIKRLNKIKELIRRLKLIIYKKDLWDNRLIGLDMMKKKLVYLQHNNKKINYIVVHLRNLKSCSLTKQYDSIEAGGLKSKNLHDYLKAVFLELRFENSSKVTILSFFEKQRDKMNNLSELEAKAKEWQETLSKLLIKQLPEPA